MAKNKEFTGKRGRPPKGVLDIELTKLLPIEADRTRFRSMWKEFSADYPNLNNSSDKIVLKDFILSSILQDNIYEQMNENNKSRILDKDLNKTLNDLDAKKGKLLETLNARRKDRPKDEDDGLSVVDLAARIDMGERAETKRLDELEENELLRKKFVKENEVSKTVVTKKETESNNVEVSD